MSKRTLWLYVGINIVFGVPTGLFAVLPDYAQRLGASPALAGYYLALSFLALAIGTYVSPAVARRITNLRLVLILMGVAHVPLVFLSAYVTNVWQLMLLTGLDWFAAGVYFALINISVGYQASPTERGRVFGTLGIGGPVGGLVGGLLGSALLAQGGYRLAYIVFGAVSLLAPLMALALAPVEVGAPDDTAKAQSSEHPVVTGSDGPVNVLVAAAIAGRVATFVGVFCIAIVMLSLKFTPAEISLASVAGNATGIVTPAILGWLSDRVGRKPLLLACYVAALIGQTMLVFGVQLWQFIVVMAIRGVYFGGVPAIGSALLTDIAPRARLPRALAWWGNAGWVGGVLAYALTGNAIEQFGVAATLWLAVALLGAATLVTAWQLLRAPRPAAAAAA